MELTPDLIAAIDESVRAGAERETAALAEGVARSTYQKWIALGANGKQPYSSWVHSLDVAEAAAEVSHLKSLEGSKDSKVHQWLLERLNNNRWGAKIQVDVTRQLTEFLTIAEGALEEEQFDKLLEAYDRALSSGGSADAAAIGAAAASEAASGPTRLH